MGQFYDTDLSSDEEFKRCFLLRHEVINIVIKTAQMIKALFEFTHGKIRSPMSDMWWWKLCICQMRINDGDLLVKCSGCKNRFHLKCVELKTVPSGDWYCGQCQTERVNDSMVMHEEEKEESDEGTLTKKKKRKKDEEEKKTKNKEEVEEEKKKDEKKEKKKKKDNNKDPPSVIRGAAEPRDDRGPRDGGSGMTSVAPTGTDLPHLRPIRRLFKVQSPPRATPPLLLCSFSPQRAVYILAHFLNSFSFLFFFFTHTLSFFSLYW